MEIWCVIQQKLCWIVFVLLCSGLSFMFGAGTERVKLILKIQKLHKEKSMTNKEMQANKEYLTALSDVLS